MQSGLTNGDLLTKLDLNSSEISAFSRFRDEFKDTGKHTKLFSPMFISLNAETRLRMKLRHEARNRKLTREADELPSFEDVEVFKELLLMNAMPPKVDDLDMVSYDGYKLSLHSAPSKIQKFLSVKLFVDLQASCKWDTFGRVLISSILGYVLKKREKLKFMIALNWYDSSYQGYLTEEDLKEYLIEQMLPRIPTLADVASSPIQEYYLCMAVRKFFFMLDRKNLKKLRIVDIVASGLLEEMLNVSDTNNEESVACSSEEPLQWFSRENCENIQKAYIDLDTDENGLLSYDELKGFRQLSSFFVKRVFEMVQTYDRDQIDLRGFCDLLLAMENKAARFQPASDVSALNFYFRLLDVDGDGYLDALDLQYFYREIAEMFEKSYPSGDAAPPFEDIKDEIFDMCRPKDQSRISLKELMDSGKGGTIVGLLTDLNCFLAYECREDIGTEE